jgi:hypothetical protein
VRTAKKAALGALAATVMAMVTPMTAASADQGDTLKGGCSFDTNEQAQVTNGQNQGVIADLSVSQEASGGPSGATVQCWIDVNGVEAPGTRISASGNGVQANSAQITFAASETDAVSECEQVTFDDGSTWVGADGTNPDCPAATQTQIPPQVVIDTINSVLALTDALNPILCPIFASLGPQDIGGVITISSDGSLVIADPVGLVVITNDCSTV